VGIKTLIMEYKGELKGFPHEVVEKMLDYQEEQGNERDVSIFEEIEDADSFDGGFAWVRTIEGHDFWGDVIMNKNFNLFFERYPKSDYPTLPKYFIIERDNSNPLWDKYIKWLNKEYNQDWDGVAAFYGYDGTSAYNGTNCNKHPRYFKNNPELITLEYWNECVNKNNKSMKKIIGYKSNGVATDEMIEAALGHKPEETSLYMEKEVMFEANSTLHKKANELKILNVWFEPVYEVETRLPEILGYEGEDLGDKVKYGCKTVSIQTIRELVKLGTEEITIYTAGGEYYDIRAHHLKKILKYYDNK